jgi:inorganic phosphate transporter, PiT family
MLVYFSSSSPASIPALIFCFGLVLAFEATNGFHDSANVVATVIYANSLRPTIALVCSGIRIFSACCLVVSRWLLRWSSFRHRTS